MQIVLLRAESLWPTVAMFTEMQQSPICIIFNITTTTIIIIIITCRVAEVVRKRDRPSPKSLDSDKKALKYAVLCLNKRLAKIFAAIFALVERLPPCNNDNLPHDHHHHHDHHDHHAHIVQLVLLRADCSNADRPGAIPQHNGLTAFGKVRVVVVLEMLVVVWR